METKFAVVKLTTQAGLGHLFQITDRRTPYWRVKLGGREYNLCWDGPRKARLFTRNCKGQFQTIKVKA